MAHDFFEGKPTLIPGGSTGARAYNNARSKVEVKYLGDFFYKYNFPIEAKNGEVGLGKKYPSEGYTCQFGFWQVRNNGDYIKRNRPGEREIPLKDGGNALISYVVTPRMCSDSNASKLNHPAVYVSGYEYRDIVDPGAVALATNGSGIVRDVASSLVDDCTADVKNSLKIGTTSPELPGETIFSGFANANHCDTMTQVILESSLKDIFAQYPGEIKPAAFDPTINSDLFVRYDLNEYTFKSPDPEQ